MPLYESAYTALQVQVRDESPIYHHATGVEISRTQRLVAEFGVHGGEITVTDPLSGKPEKRAQIRGGYFDTEEAAERLGWSEDEHSSVVAKLDKICRDEPYLLCRVESSVFAPAKPWPTYDETHWKTVSTLAETLGLVDVALAYEMANKNREPVIESLERKQAEPSGMVAPEDISRENLITLEA